MCDPLTVAAIAATVAGTAYNSNQQQKNQARMIQARNDAAAAEQVRQRAFQEESDAAFAKTRAPFEGQEQMKALGQQVQAREAASDAAVENAPSYETATAGSAPKVVSDEVARRTGGGAKEAKAQLGRGAKLTGLSDLFFNNQSTLQSGRQSLAPIIDFSSRSASLLPLEQAAAANNASKAPGMFGDLLKTAGTAAGLYSFVGGGPTWSQLFGGGGLTAPNNASFLMNRPGGFQGMVV